MIYESFYLNETRGGFETWMIATVPGRSLNLDGGGRLALFGPERIESGLGMRLQLVDYELQGLEEFTTGQRPVIVFQVIELKDRIDVRASCLDLWPALADWFGKILEIIGETWPGSELTPDTGQAESRRALSDLEEQAIGKRYVADESIAELATSYSVSESTIGRALDRQQIKRRPPGPRKKRKP